MKYLLSILVLFVSFLTDAQSPWVKDKFEGYAQVGYSGISNYRSIYDKSSSGGSRSLERTISDRTIQAYVEYGVHEKWTLLANVPLKLVSSGGLVQQTPTPVTSSGSLTALGNIDFGTRYQLYNGVVTAAAQVKVSARSASYQSSTGLSTGLASWAVEPMLSVGKGGNHFYVYGYGGVGFRTDDYSHYGRFGIEGGVDINKRVWIGAFIDAVVSFRNGNVTERTGNLQTGLYLNNQEFIGYGPKLIVEAVKDRFGINLSAGGGSNANNVAQQLSFSFGLYYKWKPTNKKPSTSSAK